MFVVWAIEPTRLVASGELGDMGISTLLKPTEAADEGLFGRFPSAMEMEGLPRPGIGMLRDMIIYLETDGPNFQLLTSALA